VLLAYPVGDFRFEIYPPFFILGHELGHAANFDASPCEQMRLGGIEHEGFTNYEEKRVITGPERSLARTLGLPPREDHLEGFYF
jgi:hypothetical protein